MNKTPVTNEMQEYLGNITDLKKLLDGSYLNDSENENFKELVNKSYLGEESRAKLLNPGSHIGNIVFSRISSYFGLPTTNFNINWMDFFEGLLTTGKIQMRIDFDNNELRTIKANRYYYDGKTEFFLSVIEHENESGIYDQGKQYYLLVETFENKLFKRKLYEISTPSTLMYGEEVSLDSVPELQGLEQELKIDADRLVIERKVEYSLLEEIRSTMYSIDRKIAEAEKNFVNYVEQYMILKNIEIPDDCYYTDSDGLTGGVNLKKLGKLLKTDSMGGEHGGIEIVSNRNELIKDALEYVDTQIAQISAVTTIPLFEFGIKQEGGQDSGTSKIKSSGTFYKKIEKYRSIVKEIFKEFWDEFNIPEKERVLEFPPIVTTDENEKLEQIEKRLNLKLISKKRAIMQIENISEEEAEIRLKEIQEESTLYDNQSNNEGA